MSFHSNQPQHSTDPDGSTVDVHVINHGSIILFHLNTPEASAWVEGNVTAEAQFFGTALVVEPRYVVDLVAGMREAGLEVR
jgi:hypothetical protein